MDRRPLRRRQDDSGGGACPALARGIDLRPRAARVPAAPHRAARPPDRDFQELPLWRHLVRQTAAGLIEHHGRPLIVPMALPDPLSRDEIVGELRRSGLDVRHFLLPAADSTLRRRLFWRWSLPASSRWARAQIGRFPRAAMRSRAGDLPADRPAPRPGPRRRDPGRPVEPSTHHRVDRSARDYARRQHRSAASCPRRLRRRDGCYNCLPRPSGGMADAGDLKSPARKGMRVRPPPRAGSKINDLSHTRGAGGPLALKASHGARSEGAASGMGARCARKLGGATGRLTEGRAVAATWR
jgi:hypothetical protein